ncbi:uncharacterized protein BP01DRAFT_378395 [Aspergillus saccharolyticus JOP 1030-1]|uniref:Uncharacterized protein n=1 Tax=Aspergillus saccharolyticus JOP 1030-1 TaxID=1450539 RepID=A0A318ZT13_9EURO|nr:hypothetical protein BP01DRAFT_378395 [Aspergillus saccharolyticus JOP 1030-1]PYH49784.1 hypothetical protein BP01DRAFT_378395 [Aspergillus saccharolyticus JOP 1030-1]
MPETIEANFSETKTAPSMATTGTISDPLSLSSSVLKQVTVSVMLRRYLEAPASEDPYYPPFYGREAREVHRSQLERKLTEAEAVLGKKSKRAFEVLHRSLFHSESLPSPQLSATIPLPTHEPRLTQVPATTPASTILEILLREGGLIVEQIVNHSVLDAVQDELQPRIRAKRHTGGAFSANAR